MARARPKKNQKKKQKPSKESASAFSLEVAQNLLDQATTSLHTGQTEDALSRAKKLLNYLENAKADSLVFLPAFELIGEINVELGWVVEARDAFAKAVELDPKGMVPEELGGGADRFLWLAQLCVDGGSESVSWFDKGAAILRKEISNSESNVSTDDEVAAVEMKKQKLANALCGAAEVYMTDLSWEDDAEARCETLVTEACVVAPDTPEPLQTLASVRISQKRMADARSALSRSMETWTSLPPDDPRVPDFPTRISLSRLLMEAEMEERALDVIDRLVKEDDSSVEAWYLGGWCYYLIARSPDSDVEKACSTAEKLPDDAASELVILLDCSRQWLQKSLQLCETREYEDDRLRDHAMELVAELNEELGPQSLGDEAAEDEAVWEDVEDDQGVMNA